MYGHTIAADAWKILAIVYTRIIPLYMNEQKESFKVFALVCIYRQIRIYGNTM